MAIVVATDHCDVVSLAVVTRRCVAAGRAYRIRLTVARYGIVRRQTSLVRTRTVSTTAGRSGTGDDVAVSIVLHQNRNHVVKV